MAEAVPNILHDGEAVHEAREALQDPTDQLRDALPQRRRGPIDKRNHLSLVELNHLLQLSNIPPRAWEAVSTMYMEYITNRHKCLTDEEIAAGKEWLTPVRDWINTLFLTSQSVDANQAERMVRGMTADREYQGKAPSSGVVGNSESGKPEAKRRSWLGA